MSSCSINPYAKTNRVQKKKLEDYKQVLQETPKEELQDTALNYGKYWVGTTNFNLRKPNYVIIHHTDQDSLAQTLKTFTLPRTQVSAHYVIGKNGEIYHMLNNYYRAWHGGTGFWGGNRDLNSSSIGIELDNNGHEPFSDSLIKSLLKLLKQLKKEYHIPQSNFIGHADIAPTRKVDPNKYFPWKELAQHGYGYWYDEKRVDSLVFENDYFKSNTALKNFQNPLASHNKAIDKIVYPNVIPNNFDYIMALRVIGYDVSNLKAAIHSFKLHFIQNNVNETLSPRDIKVLYEVYKQYL
ncbi:N-acetylmuramoyl-L-alanine amidase [Zhouia sp. PK063]|uniref:N-acetylmuramoyl-L-alanine amidase n=1 Tax=Zhouia sp. PK063 TaxID=3373602 RepID=UPI00378D6AC1